MITPDSRVWFPLFAFLSTLVAIIVLRQIDPENKYVNYIPVVASAIAAILFLFLEKVTELLMNNYNFRLIFDRSAKFEGEWLQYYLYELNNEQILLYSVFRIRYTGKKDEPYLIKGNSYCHDGTNFSTWTSARIKFDRTSNRIDYFYFGHIFTDQQEVRGFSHLNFNDSTGYVKTPWANSEEMSVRKAKAKAHKSDIHFEIGSFVDTSSTGATSNRFHFVRLTDDIARDILGKDCEKLHTFEVERQLVIELHKRYGQYIRSHGYLMMNGVEDEEWQGGSMAGGDLDVSAGDKREVART